MGVLVQGQVSDRPWGQTLGALGLRALSGQLTLHGEDGKGYAIAFDKGTVIGAWSPNAADSAPRVALTNHMLSSTQVQPIVRRIAALPDREEVDVVAELARLSPEQVATLRMKLVAQRAARTFSIDAGVFVVDDEITIPVTPSPGLDIRQIVYLGSRMNLSEERLSGELRQFGTYFQIKRDAGALDQYGFSEAELPVLTELRAGSSLHELEAAHREVDPRMVQAIVYALFACQACEISDAPAVPRAATLSTLKAGRGAGARTTTPPPAAGVESAPVVPPSEMDGAPAKPARPPSEPGAPAGAAVYERMKRASSRPASAAEFPMRTPTPPVVGRTSSEYFHTPTPSGTGEFPARMPTPPVTARATTENPFEFRTPTPPVTGLSPPRATTENPFPVRSPTPPATGRTPSENPYPQREPTPPRQSRTQTDNPFPARMLTPPVESRTSSGRRVAQGPDEPMVPRNQRATNAPRTVTPAAVDPLNPPTARTTPPRPGGAPAARAGTANPATARTGTGDPVVSRTGTGNGPAIARTTTARKTAALIAARLILLEQGADHFALLGVPFDAPIEQVTSTYLNLVRQLHPDKLAEIELEDGAGNAQKLFTAIGAAFTVLTDPAKRGAYVASVVHAGAGAPRTKTGEDVTTPAIEAFRRGESALRRDEPYEAVEHFKKAVELSPQDVDYHGWYGWALFCSSREKDKQANDTRKLLERALQKSPKPMTARFLLGRVERMLGNDERALRHFNIVLEEIPSHAEARAEVRAIEARLASGAGKKR